MMNALALSMSTALGGVPGAPVNTPVAVGPIHNDSFATNNLSGYSQSGSTMSAATGQLVINASGGAHAEYITLVTPNIVAPLGQHCMEKWVMRALFTCPTGNPFGFGLGVRANNAAEQFDNEVRIGFDTSQEANRGTVYYYNAQNHAGHSQTVALMGAGFTMVSGTDYIFEVERNKNVITARLRSSDGLTIHKAYTDFTYNITTSGGVRAHNAGQFCLWAYGATNQIIKNITVSTTHQKFCAVAFIGDSNMHGLYAAANSRRYSEQACLSKGVTLEIFAGINAQVSDVTSTLPGILWLQPRIIYINIGSNDKANGVSDATRRANMNTLVANCSTGGYGSTKTIIGSPIARNGIDIALIKTDNDTAFSSYQRPDHYTATKDAGTSLAAANNSGDNIHASPVGNDAQVSVALTAINNLIP